MNEQDKLLLLEDLCARLPYGVKCKITTIKKEEIETLFPERVGVFKRNNCKIYPYLRLMSSMTEEEGERLEQIAKETLGDFMFEAEEDGGAIYHMSKWKTLSPAMFDYLNSIHIDYRGLIPMGLALEAPEGMYNLNE